MINHSEKMQEVYAFIKDYNNDYGYPPSVRDICAQCHVKSTATVYEYINKLTEQGLLNKSPLKKRAVVLANKTAFKEVPILGKVTAGVPITAIENLEGYFPLPPDFSHKADEMFMLRVSGDSMIEAGIYDRDVIIVEKRSTAINGDIIVGMVDGEATVKRFYRRDGKIILHPENPTMEDFVFDNVDVLGKVVGLYRKF